MSSFVAVGFLGFQEPVLDDKSSQAKTDERNKDYGRASDNRSAAILTDITKIRRG
jgi:hypothetical protein